MRAPAELRADPNNDGGNGEARESVRVGKPRQVPRLAGPDEADAGDDHYGAPNVC